MRAIYILSLFCIYSLCNANPYYKIETLPLPEGEVIEVGCMALLDDDRIAVGTRRGNIWVASNIGASDLSKISWTRFTDGLYEPFGLYSKEGWLYVTDKTGLFKCKDSDGDGIADRFISINNEWGFVGDYHEFAFGSDPDADGNTWVALCLTGSVNSPNLFRGWAVRITPEGEMIPTCAGLRSPGGIGFNPEGDAFYTDNQGFWNGSSSIKHLKPGRHLGNHSGDAWYDKADIGSKPPLPLKGATVYSERSRNDVLLPPAVVFPHERLSHSPTGIIYDHTNGAFGPFGNQLLVGEQTNSELERVFLEKVNCEYQGAVFRMLKGFGSGPLSLRLSDAGQLFVGQTSRGWGSKGAKGFALERVTWNGELPFEILKMEAQEKGFNLTFTEAISKESATDLASYATEAFTYKHQSGYGSPEIEKHTLKVVSAIVAADGMSVNLEFDKLIPGHVHELKCSGIKSSEGKSLVNDTGWYTLNNIPGKPYSYTLPKVDVFNFHPKDASISDGGVRYEVAPKDVLGHWKSIDTVVSWEFENPEEVSRKLSIQFSKPSTFGGKFVIRLNGKEVAVSESLDTKSWNGFKTVDLGAVKLPKGHCKIEIQATEINGYLMNLKNLNLR